MRILGLKLFTVGPVACYPGVIEAMGRQMVSHRSEEYVTMHYETVEQLQEFLATGNSMYLFSSSGTGFMEAARAQHDKLCFVDGVSSMGGTEVTVDTWGIDIKFSSSQKCFGVPPGIGIGSVSERSLDVSAVMPDKGWYFDLMVWEKKNTRALSMIDEMGGKQAYFDLYKRRNTSIRDGLKEHGLDTYPLNGYESPTVSGITAPEGISGPDVYNAKRDHGFELALGYGGLKQSTFRVCKLGGYPTSTYPGW